MIDINSLEEGDELNPSSYNPDDYPSLEEVIESVLSRTSKRPVKVDLADLSVNGQVVCESMEDYLNNKSISSSNLKSAIKSPRTFYYDYEGTFKEKKKKCFELGTFIHLAFAEPILFKKVKVEPSVNQSETLGVIGLINFYKRLLRRKENSLVGLKIGELRKIKSELKETCEKRGFRFISEETKQVIDAIERNYFWYGGGIIQHLLKGAIPETSFYYKDEETELDVKVRPDLIVLEENIGYNSIVSIKTTSADSIGKFSYDCAKYTYELSEGMYQEVVSEVTGRRFNVTIMIMLQTVPPYDVAVLFWSPEDLQNGKYKYRYSLSIVKDCFDNNLFPGFDALAEEGNCGVIELNLPEWSKKLIHPVAIEN